MEISINKVSLNIACLYENFDYLLNNIYTGCFIISEKCLRNGFNSNKNNLKMFISTYVLLVLFTRYSELRVKSFRIFIGDAQNDFLALHAWKRCDHSFNIPWYPLNLLKPAFTFMVMYFNTFSRCWVYDEFQVISQIKIQSMHTLKRTEVILCIPYENILIRNDWTESSLYFANRIK